MPTGAIAGGGKQLPFDAFVSPDDPNTIVVDVDSRQGLTYLLGHELGHSIQHQRPDLYDAFQKEVLALAEDWDDYRQKLKNTGAYKTDTQFKAEFVNDFIGNQMGDPEFWRRLKARSPGVFGKLVGYTLDFLRTIGRRIGTRERDVQPYFRDIEAARESLVTMLEAYQRGEMPERSVRKRALDEPESDAELAAKKARKPEDSNRKQLGSPEVGEPFGKKEWFEISDWSDYPDGVPETLRAI